MKDRLVDRLPFARIVTVLAVAFGVALGLCGLNLALSTGGVFRNAGQVGSSILVGSGMIEIAVGCGVGGEPGWWERIGAAAAV